MVEEIIIYPVKSLGGARKEGWQTTNTGFLYDRHWMLIDEHGHFLTQRELPALCTFFADIHENEVRITHEGNTISWPVHEYLPGFIETKVWDDKVAVHRVNSLMDEFFSDHFTKKVFLVKQSEVVSRKHTVSGWNQDIDVSLADGYPYLIVGTSSMRRLNEKTDKPVSHDRFRPNILVSTSEPHEEDSWPFMQIGPVTFKKVKPCARCQVVNINPGDGSKDDRVLKTLSAYRKDGFKVNFGTLMVVVSNGMIHVGDEVSVFQHLPIV